MNSLQLLASVAIKHNTDDKARARLEGMLQRFTRKISRIRPRQDFIVDDWVFDLAKIRTSFMRYNDQGIDLHKARGLLYSALETMVFRRLLTDADARGNYLSICVASL
jgi:hypothetical protein